MNQDRIQSVIIKVSLPNIKSTAIASSQPYAEYQLEQAKTIFWKNNLNIEIKAIAKEETEISNYSDIFNSIARTIFAGKDRILEKVGELDSSESIKNYSNN